MPAIVRVDLLHDVVLPEPDAKTSPRIRAPVVQAASVDIGNHVAVHGPDGVGARPVTPRVDDERVGNRSGDVAASAVATRVVVVLVQVLQVVLEALVREHALTRPDVAGKARAGAANDAVKPAVRQVAHADETDLQGRENDFTPVMCTLTVN